MLLQKLKLFPRSLHARMVLLVLGTILLVQAATFGTVSYYREKFNERVAVEFTATTLRTLRAALTRIPDEERADFVRNASQGAWRLWASRLPADASMEERRRMRAPHPPHPPPKPPPDDVRRHLRQFIDALNERLDEGTRVALSRGPEPRLYVSLHRIDDPAAAQRQREWLVIPLNRLAPPMESAILLMWLGGMGLLLLLAAAFSWHITRPLTRLAQAADQLAAGQPRRVAPSGPTETRVLAERFNAMLDALAESNAVQRTLLAGLPHDLKGPLSRMWLRIEMADDAGLQDGMRQDIQDMQRIVNQFVDFLRGSDLATYQFSRLALAPWLEERVAAWESAGSGVALTALPPAPLNMPADPVALGRLLDNLVSNALTHGRAPVEVALTAESGHAVLTVSDHGPGIDTARRAEALRPFSRLDDARTRTGSVGLGLALADAIARAHRGTLNLETAESGGLRVRVRLPLDAFGPDAASPGPGA